MPRVERCWVKQCVVPGCTNYGKSVKEGVPFHQFPKNDVIRRQWLVNIQSDNLGINMSWQQVKNYRVCGKHFKEEDYKPDTKHMLAPHIYRPTHALLDGAVPSVFPLSVDSPSSPAMTQELHTKAAKSEGELASAGSVSPESRADTPEQVDRWWSVFLIE